jgi:hypothetical protein
MTWLIPLRKVIPKEGERQEAADPMQRWLRPVAGARL